MIFAHELLEQTGLAITPGIDFGQNHPERYVRLTYTKDISCLEQAVQRLEQFIKNNK